MSDVRFLILCGPPSLDPTGAGFPPAEISVTRNQSVAPGARRSALKRRSGAAGELASVVSDGWWYAWRLMASNNRQLAHGVTSFSTRSRVVETIGALRLNLLALEPVIAADEHDGSWGWRAEHDGVPVALCPHRYERERDCRVGFTRFTETVPRAQIAEGGMVLHDRQDRAATFVPAEESRRWLAH